MRKIFGMTGDDDEQPANKSAEIVSFCAIRSLEESLQSNMIASAINIMST